MRYLNILTGIFIVSIMLTSCSDEKVKQHTHIYFSDQNLHIWTYQKVKSKHDRTGDSIKIDEYYKSQLRDGELIVLDNGTKLEIKGNHLYVDTKKIPQKTTNIFIDSDGKVHLNEFIGTFK